ncbi:MAG TPA: LacI family DNA-binding transcriptional regulator [Aggregatilineales bacterium]|nr:LacI family DNA-binding transcriptional regulator [Aggregatilineales bacterium]
MSETNTRRFHKITIVDVARAAGVSHATVSRVLNNQGYIGEQTRLRVMAEVERLGYIANATARSLAGANSYLLGMMIPEFYGNYVGELSQSVDLELSNSGYNLAIFPTHGHPEKETWYINRIINGLVDGLIIMLPQSLNQYLPILKAQQIPYVLLDSERADPDSAVISTTNWQGAYDATRYLIGLGHRRIGHILGLETRLSSAERLEGYQAALHESDIAFDPLLVEPGFFRLDMGYEAARQLLALPNPPTAIFAANDASAFGAIKAAEALGINVPADLSVVGFDGQEKAELANLTTVHAPIALVGQLAARALIDRVKNPDGVPARETVATSLVIRKSCAPPRRVISEFADGNIGA